jgi:phosphosulfolactate synthase (CoM biosynthesis protein A)
MKTQPLLLSGSPCMARQRAPRCLHSLGLSRTCFGLLLLVFGFGCTTVSRASDPGKTAPGNTASFPEARSPFEPVFPFLRRNQLAPKPRTRALTEIRGPYYTPVGKRYLADVLETMGPYIDSFKFAGGSFMLMDRRAVKELIDLCHQHDVLVSTGGFIEAVLLQGPEAVDRYIEEAKLMGFDIIEVSAAMIVMSDDDFVGLVKRVNEAGLKAKAEIGIQFGAGGDTDTAEHQAEGSREVTAVIDLGRRLLDAGAWMLMIQSEGLTENVPQWRTGVIAQIATGLGTERVMFQAADSRVLRWYVQNYGPDVNLFIDHSQIVQLESLRSGIWGPKNLWNRVVRYR